MNSVSPGSFGRPRGSHLRGEFTVPSAPLTAQEGNAAGAVSGGVTLFAHMWFAGGGLVGADTEAQAPGEQAGRLLHGGPWMRPVLELLTGTHEPSWSQP